MQGKRVADGEWPEHPGEYSKHKTDRGIVWFAVCPLPFIGGPGSLANHNVIEHEDGTITVSPSILIEGHRGDRWHGYLTRGIWQEC